MFFPMEGRGRRAISVILAVWLTLIFGAGCGNSEDASRATQTDMTRYRSTLEAEAATLAGWIVRLAVEAERGRLNAAKSRYATARVSFGHLAPLVIATPGLNVALEAEPGEVPGRSLTGFHQVEQMLWTKHSTAERRKAIRQLFLNVKTLQEKAKTADFTAEEIARHINEVLAVRLTREILGDEEFHARIDLLDTSAQIEGVEAAFQAIKPTLLQDWPGLVKQVEDAFEGVYRAIRPLGIAAREPEQPRAGAPGVAFVSYDDAKKVEVKKLKWRLDTLIRLLSEVPAAIVTSENPPKAE